jgi:phospholipid transport system substrate-binding protein
MRGGRWVAIALALATIGLGPVAVALAGEPTDFIRSMTERTLRILDDPKLQGADQQAQRQQLLRQVSGEAFDWQEMARRALATHWRARTPQEREEFVRLFRDLVESIYVDRLDRAAGERQAIQYVGEQIEDGRAVVRTKVITTRGTEVPIDYRLQKSDGQWRIYDVMVEGVSLVNNYRSQFNRIITTSSYQALVQRMKERRTEDLAPGSDRRGR